MKKLIGLVAFLSVFSANAMVCVILPDDGKSYPFDKEAIDLVAALKPAANCDGKQVTRAVEILGKKMVKRVATDAEAIKIRAANKERSDLRLNKRLLKAGLKK